MSKFVLVIKSGEKNYKETFKQESWLFHDEESARFAFDKCMRGKYIDEIEDGYRIKNDYEFDDIINQSDFDAYVDDTINKCFSTGFIAGNKGWVRIDVIKITNSETKYSPEMQTVFDNTGYYWG